MRKLFQTVALVACTTLLVAGCSNSDKPPSYVNVAGSVTFDGKPLSNAIIIFSTDGRPPSQIQIIDGQYNGQAMIGSNRISISAKRKGAGAANGHMSDVDKARMAGSEKARASQGGGRAPDESETGEETIPTDFSSNSKQMRVIEAGVQNKFDFDIKTKK